MRDLLQAAPSTWPHILTINNHILAGEMYKALKSAQNLIAYEEALVAAVGASRSIAATEFDRTDGNPVCPRDYRGDISGKRAPERDQLAVGRAASTHAQARRRASHLR